MKILEKQQLLESTCAIVLTIAMVFLIFLSKSIQHETKQEVVKSFKQFNEVDLSVK